MSAQLLGAALGDDVLLVSGSEPGGLFAISAGGVEQLDDVRCRGLRVTDDGLLLRLVTSVCVDDPPAVVTYDERGLARYVRLGDVRQGHDVIAVGDMLAVASTGSNEVRWFDVSGAPRHAWQADPFAGDSWHVNTLTVDDAGRLLCTAFGRYGAGASWEHDHQPDTGVVLDTESGEVLLSGLDKPHHLRRVGERWIACNSGRGELVEIVGGSIGRRVALRGYPRGLAVLGDLACVGESVHRLAPRGDAIIEADVALVDLATGCVAGRVAVPQGEVYDIVRVPASLARAVGVRGLHSNGSRRWRSLLVHTEAARTAHDVRMDALEPIDLVATIDAAVPATLEGANIVEIPCSVHNRGSATWSSAPPHPIHLAARWTPVDMPHARGPLKHPQPRSSLGTMIPADEQRHCTLRLTTPATPGNYLLEITLVQELVAWFSDHDAASSVRCAVEVLAPTPQG